MPVLQQTPPEAGCDHVLWGWWVRGTNSGIGAAPEAACCLHHNCGLVQVYLADLLCILFALAIPSAQLCSLRFLPLRLCACLACSTA